MVLEDLSWSREKTEGGRDFRWELRLWAYGKIQRYIENIEYKASCWN